MKSLLSIGSLLLCLVLQAQIRSLRSETFEHLELSQQWVIAKYHPAARMAPGVLLNSTTSTQSSSSILDGMIKLPVEPGDDPIEVCNRLLENAEVLYAEPIIHYQLLETPSDPLVGDQYYLDKIRAYDAWEITRGDDDITVAIIDSGIDLDHEDLVENLWVNSNDPIDGVDNDGNGFVDDYYGYDFADDDNDPESDLDDHGARVAGVAGATVDNGIGIAGIGYNTKIASLKGFSSANNLSFGLFDAIRYAADNGIEVMNLSWGGIREPLQSEQDIINYAVLEKGVVVIAAAGNEGTRSTAEDKFYPASYDNVLSVGGSTADDTKWSGSSYNHTVDLIAPASGVLSTGNGSSYNSSAGFGTSFAAPMVAATAALVIDKYPDLNAQQVMERIRVTTDDIYDIGTNMEFDGKLGSGRLNAFRAVTENNLKSLRAENITITKQGTDPIFYGDTLQITLDLKNYLNGLTDPGIYITSPEEEFTAATTTFFPGGISSLSATPLSFVVILSDQLTPETLVDLRLDFQDGTYSDFQFIDITTAPDYADFGNSELELSIAGDGRLGFISSSLGINDGLFYQNKEVLTYSGIILATDQNSVSDNIINNFDSFATDNDFTNSTYYKIGYHPFADRYGTSAFTDNNHDLLIEQSNITSSDGRYLINRYRVVNLGLDTIKNLTFGVYADWDLDNDTLNYAQFSEPEGYLLFRNADSTLYAGNKLLGNGALHFSAIDLQGFNGNTADIDNNFSDAEKYAFITSDALIVAGGINNGNDVAGTLGITLDDLSPGQFSYLTHIYALGGSSAELGASLDEAEAYLSSFIQHPEVAETLIICENGSVLVDPEGDLFIFYEDAEGTIPLDTAATFSPISIDRDTSFYVRNLDQGFPTEIKEVRLRLFDDIADFTIDQDTLYLDHPTTNIATFTDQSINAISWLWDFGQGTLSNLQNPSILFSTPGTYTITLTAENNLGCVDDVSKNLVVAERPPALTFDEISTCPNEDVVLSNPLASELYLYSSLSQSSPILTGEFLEFGPFDTDTTLYVAGKVEGFLTKRTPVAIDVLEVPAEITITPDTLSADFRLIASAVVGEGISTQWKVNGEAAGSETSISIPATAGSFTFELEASSGVGCTITQVKDFEVSSSLTPVGSSIEGCQGTTAVLRPENGSYFGFYEDSELTQLIAKGRQLTVSEDRKLYVVSLDDGLPGKPVEVDVRFEVFTPKIQFQVSEVGGRNQVTLSVESEIAVNTYQWYVGNESTTTSATPIFFFDNEVVEIILEAESTLGCVASDTIQLDLVPPEQPLGTDNTTGYSLYPNPSRGLVTLLGPKTYHHLQLKDLAGREVFFRSETINSLDFSELPAGIYVLEIHFPDRIEKVKVSLE